MTNINNCKITNSNFLSKEELIAHLQNRFIKIDNMCAMSKEQLVDLYNRVFTPLEQRITRRTQPNTFVLSNERDPMEVSEVENSRKRPKLSQNNYNENVNCNQDISALKRKINDTKISDNKDVTPVKKNRQRIIWP